MKERQRDIDFEIKFYEGVVKKKPDFIDALSALGDLYTKKGEYKKGLAIDEKLSLLRPDDPIVFYNLACSYSLVNETDKAFRSIKCAVKCGYDDFNYMEEDADLSNLHDDSRFQKYFLRVRKKTPENRK